MHVRHLVPACLVACIAFGAPALAQAPNDNCTSPQTLVGTGVFPFDCTTATIAGSGPVNPICANIGHDLWYQWTAPATGNATLMTCGLTNYDSNIAVYPNPGCPIASTNWCDDDACGNLESLVVFPVQVGSIYMIQIGGSGLGASGSGSFSLNIAGPPANDDCNFALSIGSNLGASYDNSAATSSSQGNPTCTTIGADLWFLWTAPQNGSATLDTCFQSSDDTCVAVYLGSGCPSGASIACDDDSCGIQSMMTWPIVIGATYTLQIGSHSAGSNNSFVITLQGGGTSAGTPYCFGDGFGTACPCGNSGAAGHGCGNSVVAAGARLDAQGSASVSNDTLVLQGTDMPPNTSALYFQGTTQTSGGPGAVFGDGLRCASGTVLRLGIRTNDGTGSSAFGAPVATVPISIKGQIPAGGGTREYQVWYRNAAPFCTTSTFNLTNGIEVVWQP